MIKFFRKIRQKLLSENKFSKYLIYAIGEILLVMIGILLAFQVNTWNESNKLHKDEISSLLSIKSDLLVSAKNLGFCNSADSLIVKSYDIILEHIQNRMPYHDSLSVHFGELLQWAKPVCRSSAYENLKSSKGLALISNEPLRQEIIKVHEILYVFSLENEEKEEAMIHQELMLPLFASLFMTNKDGGTVPIDYSSLFTDQKFMNVISLTRHRRISSISSESELKNYLYQLVSKIESELVTLNQ